jgi:hypothetical protein
MCYIPVILFFLLTPGILVTLPPKCDKYTVAFVHAIIFGLILWLIKMHRESTYEDGKYY